MTTYKIVPRRGRYLIQVERSGSHKTLEEFSSETAAIERLAVLQSEADERERRLMAPASAAQATHTRVALPRWLQIHGHLY